MSTDSYHLNYNKMLLTSKCLLFALAVSSWVPLLTVLHEAIAIKITVNSLLIYDVYM